MIGFILVHIVHLKQPKGVQCTVQLEAVGRSLLESKVSMQSYSNSNRHKHQVELELGYS